MPPRPDRDTRLQHADRPAHQSVASLASTIGAERTVSHVGAPPAPANASPQPQQGWRNWVHKVTRLNMGPSRDETHLRGRIRRNIHGSYLIGVLGLKGGVGKTALTVGLGSALAQIRGDRVLAIDADPSCGNLADRVGRQSAATIADLMAAKDLSRYDQVRVYTSVNAANLEVLAAEEYLKARRALTEEEWRRTLAVASRHYNLVLADCGAGVFDPATRGVLSKVSGLVIVASASIDAARQAGVAMDWLHHNGYHELVSRASLVINNVVPKEPNIAVDQMVGKFERHVQRGRVVVLPWDKHVAAGTEIHLDELGSTYRRRIVELAAALSDDFERAERH